ncbi:MAG: M12 family metallo-peptidase [Planctomycetota bacterium]|jgi:hypothetical protein
MATSVALAGLTVDAQVDALSTSGRGPGEREAVAAPPSDQPLTLRERVEQHFGISRSTLLTITVDAPLDRPLQLTLPVRGRTYVFDLEPHSVRAPGFRLMAETEGGALVPVDPGPVRTYRGHAPERPGCVVAASLLEDGVHALIETPEDGRHWLQPLAGAVEGAAPDQYVLYDDEDVIPSGGSCQMADGAPDHELAPAIAAATAPGGVAGTAGTCISVAQLAIEADYAYFQDYGTIGAVQSKIESVLNATNLQFERDVQITHEATALLVRTSAEDDPYDTNDAVQLLTDFRNLWRYTPPLFVDRDVTHLFTGRELNGSTVGVAWGIGLICTSGAYCLTQSDCCTPNLACATDLTAHELGHLWGADHCDCADPAYSMNDFITCINRFSPIESIPQIISHRDSRSCLTSLCAPENDGCANAQSVADGDWFFTTINAGTDGPAESSCSFGSGDSLVQADVWYRYDSVCNGPVTVDVCNATFDTRLAVYESICPFVVNSAIACDDNGCGDASQLTFEATAGTSYLLRVGGRGGQTGIGTLTIQGPGCVPPPSNDTCGNALTVEAGQTAVSTIGATSAGPAETGCGVEAAIENDVWFRYLADCDGTLSVEVCDGDFNVRAAVYEGTCPIEPDNALACGDDPCGASAIAVPVTAGTIYRIRVGASVDAAGDATLSLACDPACASDVDGDGVTDVDDLTMVILAWGTDDPAADVDGSGAVDVDDLLAVLGAWGSCP